MSDTDDPDERRCGGAHRHENLEDKARRERAEAERESRERAAQDRELDEREIEAREEHHGLRGGSAITGLGRESDPASITGSSGSAPSDGSDSGDASNDGSADNKGADNKGKSAGEESADGKSEESQPWYRRIPKRLANGRVRTTTAILVVVWVVLLACYGQFSDHYKQVDRRTAEREALQSAVNSIRQQSELQKRLSAQRMATTSTPTTTSASTPESVSPTAETTTDANEQRNPATTTGAPATTSQWWEQYLPNGGREDTTDTTVPTSR